MAADEKLGPQFELSYHDVTEVYGHSTRTHQIRAKNDAGDVIGAMTWNAKEIGKVFSDRKRQGVATAMWEEAHRLAGESNRIPTPKHSGQRTDEGDAWARAVGGRLPRRR